MIGGIGAIQFKTAVDGAESASPNLLQGGVGTSESIGSSFADVLSQAATKTVNTLQGAEQMSIQALKGDADTRQVVDAVLSAQQALQTTIAIRDKVVSAYLEISRMSI
ncbi:flagellar hook-basal body complex protein FliE [Mesorhizobium sp.]|uniref:flagellar hook-basal body complex protein FliE n=1 Tax=Mesorhizobium sp. TaxID=1871066 RepID=UPI000FE2B26F|nr:flagellar hook-basal body complex protein FliE [Mesorhizobium sp.]RWH72758.1 MAG: flagellar hook-basal body complex protein FliE [Mesorhizobium sp.]RWL34356.1 MAG: flagellar hook-basal body complex protein FliE [Mesorhizobium sp.]RWL35771.1 MAG: flagellar hook-basal body complex protein FliE [Mesorhizobium sp.]RWL41181.1 MAG: flagellar hook-basal body complex protein FliE [Mesorhizobium sp.]RWL55765.1 MAG: flagellar hook-basal body complex protein FliE [Mesorhizobium sp.]